MTRRRIVYGVLAGAVLLFAVGLSASPLPGLVLAGAIEELYPAAISWEGKTAWRRCDSAIAGETEWPRSPQAACAAMQLCVNEAPLSETQTVKLWALIRATPDCPAS